MKKTIISILLLCLLLTVLPVGVLAAETETIAPEVIIREPYQCGEDLTWSYDAGTLTISGNGNMDDYPDGDAPWLEYKDSITRVVFDGNVTSVGACAFMDYDSLTYVSFGSAMHTIGPQAFMSCDGLTELFLPDTFRKFGKECFRGCESLTAIRCRGGMPRFDDSCLWDVYATVYYPSNNPWPVDPVTQLFQAFQGRIQFFMAGADDLLPVEDEARTTVVSTEPAVTQPPVTELAETVPETTVPETTEAETQPTTEPVEETEEVTEAPTTEATEPEWLHETQPVEEEKDGRFSGVWFGMFLITGTLSLILIGALVFRRRRY